MSVPERLPPEFLGVFGLIEGSKVWIEHVADEASSEYDPEPESSFVKNEFQEDRTTQI